MNKDVFNIAIHLRIQMESISPKKIIIVGATSGIGKEMALQYLQKGYYVGITGRREILLHEIKQKFPSQIFTQCFDVRGDNNIDSLIELMRKMDGVDIFIYNAGYGEPGVTLNPEIEKLVYETNVKGFVDLTSYMFNYFIKQGYGHIAATSSIASIKGLSLAPGYSASKAFMSTYMEGLHMKAKRLKANIYITDIQPGFIKTKVAKNKQFWAASPQKAARQIIAAIDAKKWRVYVTKRWWLMAKLIKYVPSWIYHRFA
jgi:short-subunit dehydrogenase